MTKKGRTYEHALGDLIGEATNGELVPLSTGYNSAYTRAVDLLIDDGEAVHAFELKRTSKDAYTMHWDEDEVQRDDLYGLCRFCVQYPRPTYPYAGVRFNNRALAVTKLYLNDYPDADQVLEKSQTLSPIEAKVTHADNLRFYQPDASSWPTTDLDRSDTQHVLDAIGFQL